MFVNSHSRVLPSSEKVSTNQGLARRKPRQQRSIDKVELMFEAAMLLIQESGVASLTTNAVAARAGVSIGTLYQYFDGKPALLEALTLRELGSMRAKFVGAIKDVTVPARPGERIRQLVRIVTRAYGGRGLVHRQLIEHALAQGISGRLSPVHAQIAAMFSSHGVATADGRVHKLTPAQAFVVTHATAGTLRALAAQENPPPIEEIEDALVQMVYGYLAGLTPAAPSPV